MICDICGDFVPLLNMEGHLKDEHPEPFRPAETVEWGARSTIDGHVIDFLGFPLDKETVENVIEIAGRKDLEVVKRTVGPWEKA